MAWLTASRTWARGSRTKSGKRFGTRPCSTPRTACTGRMTSSSPLASQHGRRSRCSANATSSGCARRRMSSSTRWLRRPCGIRSRPRSSTSTSSLCSSNSVGKSYDRASGRSDRSSIHRDHQRARAPGYQWRRPAGRPDVESMVRTAVADALAGHNAYIEARTVREDLRGNRRGEIEDTAWVFGLVADCDADKGKGGNIAVRPSLVIETSPGNFHYWYLLTRAVPWGQAKVIGDAIRASSGADKDTGVVTQPYRIAGTPNFPSAEKQARGRITIEPTRIAEQTGRLWDPDELLQAFSAAPAAAAATAASVGAPIDDESTLPAEL